MDANAAVAPAAGHPGPSLARRARAASDRFGRLGVSLVDQASVSATNFLTGVLIGRACSQEQLGLYGIGLAVLLIITEFHQAFVSTPHQVLYPKWTDAVARRRFNGSALLHSLSIGVVAGVGLAVAGAVVGGEIGGALLALAVAAWAVLARHFARLFSFTTLRPSAALALDGGVALLQLGGLAVLAWTGRLSATSAFLWIGLANLASLVAWLLPLRREFAPSPQHALADVKTTWPLSRWIVLSGITWTLGMHAYPLLVGGLRSAAEAGVWTACFGIAALANPLLMGVQNWLGPAVAHAATDRSAADFRRLVLHASAAFGLLMVPVVLGTFLFGDLLVQAYGPEYAEHGSLVALLTLATLCHAVGFPSARGLFADGHAIHDFLGNVVTLALLLAVGIWLVSAFGVTGAAWSFVIGLAAGNAYRLIAFLCLAGKQEVAA